MRFEPLPAISDDEQTRLGQWVNERYCKPFRVRLDDGSARLVTQFEMSCAHDVRREEVCQRRERDGCCGAEPDAEGRCPEWPDKCPRYSEAVTATAWCESLIKWLEELEQE